MTPTDDPLAVVLAEIAEIEGREGFKGPKITEAFDAIKWIADDFDDQELDDDDGNMLRFPPAWTEDILIGEIVRAVKAHRNPQNHLDDWMIDIEDGGDGGFIVLVKDRLGHKIAVGQGPLALAAARAYRDAIGGGDRG